MDELPQNTLIIYVPGYAEQGPGVRLRGYVQWAIENAEAPPGKTWIAPPDPEERPFQGYSGLRYTIADAPEPRFVDMIEVPWQGEVTKLADRPRAVRLTRGLRLMWINFWSGLRTLRSSPGYALATGIALVLLLLWLYLLASSIVGAVDAARKGTVLAGPFAFIPPFVKTAWHVLEPKGWVYFGVVIAIFVLSLARIDPAVIADIGDLYDRFAHNRTDPGDYVTARSTLVRLVRNAMRGTIDKSYGRVVVLGHSFGALIACAAVAKEKRPVELITVGTYFSYLDNLDRDTIDALFKSVLAAPIERWIDYYSKNDWLASSRGYARVDDDRYKPREADLKPNITFMEKLTGATHKFYFEDVEVLRTIFEAPSQSRA